MPNKKAIVPIEKKLLLTIPEAAAYSNIGVYAIRKLLKMTDCPFLLRVANKMLIKRVEFERYLINFRHVKI